MEFNKEEEQLMKNETVRSITSGQLKDMAATLIGAIPELSFEDADFITGKKGIFVHHVKKAFSNVLKLKSPKFIVRIINDFKTAIRAGAYDYVYDEINTKNFPMTSIQAEEVEIKLFSFGYKINTDFIISEMAKEGYKPGRIEHLLAFEAENPHAAQFITALGSNFYHPIEKRKVYPAIWTVTGWKRELRKDVAERTLGWQLDWPDDHRRDVYLWSVDHIFLGFRRIEKNNSLNITTFI